MSAKPTFIQLAQSLFFLGGHSDGIRVLTYKYIPAQNGPLFSAQAQASYVLSPSTIFSLQAGLNRQDATIDSFAYTGFWVGGSYSQDLPAGFSAQLDPSYYVTYYDAPLAGFGLTRNDTAFMLQLGVLNRRLDYHGFTPRFSYTFTKQHSSVAFYDYVRSQFQVGVTSRF